MTSKPNIAEILRDEPRFSIFVEGLILTQLIDELSETGPFTVMAPSNSAFSRLPKLKMIELMKPANKKNLAEIMKYHVVDGKWISENLARLTTVRTLQYQSLRIEGTDFGFKVNGASLQNRNIEASNGVIHGISDVLFPAIAIDAV